MPTTTNYDLPYPALGDAPDVPADLAELATAVDTELSRVDTDVAAAQAAGILVGRCIRRHRRTTTSSNSTGTDVGVIRFDDVAVTAGRLYVVMYRCNPNSSIGTDILRTQVRYTTDGSTPGTSSTVLPGSTALPPDGTGTITQIAEYTPGSDLALSLLLCVGRETGSGNVNLFADGPRATSLLLFDCGEDPGDGGGSV